MISSWQQWHQGGIDMINDYEITRVQQQHKGLIALKWLLLAIGCYLVLVVLPEQIGTVEQGNESYRVRVIANSNTVADQQHKKMIAGDVEAALQTLYVDEAVDKLKLMKILKNKYPQTEMHIEYGDNLFPAKFNQGIFSPQNQYKSLVVSIGSARGNNWWCSVFKKVCEKDVDEEVDEEDEEPVKFWIWEWIKEHIL